MSDVQGENEIITLAPTTDPNISTLTDSQESTMSILGAISGSLSILGSSLIVYRVYKNRHSTSPYDRIMLGLSICDIVSSFSFGLGPLLLPTDTSTRAWASGNERTCNFLGFLTQFSFCAVWYVLPNLIVHSWCWAVRLLTLSPAARYNGLLSLYYLMTVRFGVKRQVFAKKYEPYMHCLSLAFFLSTSISGLIIGLYSELEYVVFFLAMLNFLVTFDRYLHTHSRSDIILSFFLCLPPRITQVGFIFRPVSLLSWPSQ